MMRRDQPEATKFGSTMTGSIPVVEYICHRRVPLLPLRRTDNTDIVRCEHSFRPDGTIFQSSPSFPRALRLPPTAFSALADCCSLPLFHLQHRYPMRNWRLSITGRHSFVYLFIYYIVAWVCSLRQIVLLISRKGAGNDVNERSLLLLFTQWSQGITANPALYHSCNFVGYDVFHQWISKEQASGRWKLSLMADRLIFSGMIPLFCTSMRREPVFLRAGIAGRLRLRNVTFNRAARLHGIARRRATKPERIGPLRIF